MFIVPQVMAQTCLYSLGGSCLFWSGSVSCENLSATGLGNVAKDPTYIRCTANATAADPTQLAGVVFCSNKGGNVAPGINGFILDSLTGAATINQSQVDSNGNATGISVHATPTAEDLAYLTTNVCMLHNKNWFAIDFVPAAMTVNVQTVDDDTPSLLTSIVDPTTGLQLYPNGTDGDNDDTADCVATNTCIDVISTATFNCLLPNPETLSWDKVANAPERRQYNCTQQ